MKKILIIEDDSIVGNIYRNKFAHEGYLVEVALDGETGLKYLDSFAPDLVILDLMLPKLSGVEVIKRIRERPTMKKLPIVVFSNTYLSNMVQDAWRAGATKCLSKANCTPKQVIEVVRTVMPAGDTAAVHRAPPAAATPPATTHSEAEAQSELRQSFIESLPAMLASMRIILKSLVRSDSEATRLVQIQELYRKVHGLTGNAGIAGMNYIAQMADATEALLKELHEKPKNITASTLRTVAHAVDFLGILFEQGNFGDGADPATPKILVVDDEVLSRRAVTHALEKAKLPCVNVEDPNVAYSLLAENPFDLVFLDVDMPGMTGFELCAKLRNLPLHQKTPVVFVTSLNDFENRANSTVSGGNDFIAKPFLFIELGVKALVYVLRGRLPVAKPVTKPSAA